MGDDESVHVRISTHPEGRKLRMHLSHAILEDLCRDGYLELDGLEADDPASLVMDVVDLPLNPGRHDLVKLFINR